MTSFIEEGLLLSAKEKLQVQNGRLHAEQQCRMEHSSKQAKPDQKPHNNREVQTRCMKQLFNCTKIAT